MAEIKIGKINVNRVQEGGAYKVTMLPGSIIGDNKFNPKLKLGVDIIDNSSREVQHIEEEFHLNGLFSSYYENMIYSATVELKSVEIEYGGIRFTFIVNEITSKTFKIECFTDMATLISYSVDFGSAHIYPRQIKSTSNALHAETAGSAGSADEADRAMSVVGQDRMIGGAPDYHMAGLYITAFKAYTKVGGVSTYAGTVSVVVAIHPGWDGSKMPSGIFFVPSLGTTACFTIEHYVPTGDIEFIKEGSANNLTISFISNTMIHAYT